MEKIPVLVVDDSALMRNLISSIINSDHLLETVGTAVNGLDALNKLASLKPAVITLDLEMPEMGGIEFLKELSKRRIDIPVIVLSSIAVKGAAVTMEALSLGAADFITKPSGSISIDIHKVSEQVNNLIKAYGQNYLRRQLLKQDILQKIESDRPILDIKRKIEETPALSCPVRYPATSAKPPLDKNEWPAYKPLHKPGRIDVVCVGISTGGPNALRTMLAGIDAKLRVPVLIVQHMPAGFTYEFAKSLDRICPLTVQEAKEGDVLKPGMVFIAPGDSHMLVEKSPLRNTIKLTQTSLRNGHRPSVDELFESVAHVYGNRTLAVLMTGMGKDGARQLGELYRLGAHTLAQDKESCIVYGMPKMAVEANYVHRVIPLDKMASTINKLVRDYALA